MSDASPREEQRVDVDHLLVGFGYSSIPLLREYDRCGESYVIISAGPSIWEQLAAAGRLDFDLVSSHHSSFYSFSQIERGLVEDYYPSAKEFYEYQIGLFAPYRDKVITDKVIALENRDTHSIVTTAGGQCYKAQNVVFATGLGREQNQTIKELERQSISGKTVVFGTMGDTANMMIARLVPQGNRVILLQNGFMALDKTVFFTMPGPKRGVYIPMMGIRTGKEYSLDLAQYEAHNVGRLFPRFYKSLFLLVQGMPAPTSWFGRLVMPHALHVCHPETWRPEVLRTSWGVDAAVRNGLVALKHWPIDMYKNRFEDDLEGAIHQGSLMNDIAFFFTEGLVESWPKDHTTVDLENKTICRGDDIVSFDHYIGGGYESPRLPQIVRVHDTGERHSYEYNYTSCLLGVVPSELKNVYFIGYTRPWTGGIANVTEMQCLMVHKLTTDKAFSADVYANIGERIQNYNSAYYPYKHLSSPTDHLVHYGLYTGDIAELIGIDRKISAGLSLHPLKTYFNLRFELLHPNNPLKFRMEGEYAVEGAEKLCRKIAAHNEHWAIMLFLFLSSLWDKLTVALLLVLLYVREALLPFLESGVDSKSLPLLAFWTAVCASGGLILYLKSHNLNVITYSTPLPLLGPKSNLQPLALLYIACTGDWRLCVLLLAFICGMVFFFRQFHFPPISGRYLFGDCKYKYKYRPFWEEYLATYKRLHEEDEAS